jgi:2-polyprenyl-3-methyl-5-hydroxy-6-metoxy-1,4-benzoquinol methylase
VEVASSVTAVDISARMLEQLQQRVTSTRLTAVCMNVSDLSILAGYGGFDTAIAMRLLPHLEDPVAVLTTMAGAIKPGGNVVFDLWNPYSFVGLVRKLASRPSHVLTRCYSYRHILRMVEASGLIVEDRRAWGYPRIGRFSADRLGNRLLKPLGYAILFNTVRG